MQKRKIIGIFLFFFSVFVFVSIVIGLLGIARDLVGLFGVKIFNIFYSRFGVLSFFFPVAGMLLSYALITSKFKSSFVMIMTFLFVLFAVQVFICTWLPDINTGRFGLILSDIIVSNFGKLGSLLISAAFLTLTVFILPVRRRDDSTAGEMAENAVESISGADETKSVERIEKDTVPASVKSAPKAKNTAISAKLPDNLFTRSSKSKPKVDPKKLEVRAMFLEDKLKEFGISGKVVSIHYGPVVSMFEYKPASGVKVSKILNLSDDIARVMKVSSVRIVAPIAGKDTVGIEIPNDNRETVFFSDVVSSPLFKNSRSPLSIALGKDIYGNPYVTDLKKMPHLLVAGATGSGKSVGLNSIICSILLKASYKEVKFMLIDPKMLEFSCYNDIPHLLTPVITDPKKATAALAWAIREMEQRYKMLTEAGARNIDKYNESGGNMHYIVIVIDELADLMMAAGKEVESHITRLAQKARAAGIHLVVATQRPSVDVITGLIKANFPSRIAFKVTSRADSRTIIDVGGAEKLLGAGDMLFMPPGSSELIRLHGCFISDEEIDKLVGYWKEQAAPDYREDIFTKPEVQGVESLDDDYDELYEDAVSFVVRAGYASASMLQRHFKIGYNRAARLIEKMEREGIVGPAQGSKPREVLRKGYG